MKPFICCLLSMLIIFQCSAIAVYVDEICFRDTHWLITVDEFLKTVYPEISADAFTEDDLFGPRVNQYSSIGYLDKIDASLRGSAKSADNIFTWITLGADDDFLVAGHPVSTIQAHAIPRVENGKVYSDPLESILIEANYFIDHRNINDVTFVYRDLFSKLQSKYGEPDHVYSEYHNVYTTWYGANDTFVQLYGLIGEGILKDNPSYVEVPIQIRYGITNASEYLDLVAHPEKTIDPSNLDGL